MKFFNLDLHISVIEDIKDIFNDLGHEVTSWNISGHNWVFGRSVPQVDVVNQQTWKSIDQNMCDQFYARYRDELADYDGFIACYPPAFALLYEKFDKPIIVVAATRYEYPTSNNDNQRTWLDYKLKSMIDSGQIIPIANNKYDKFYCEYFLEREFTHIPSICKYTNCKYAGSQDPIVSGRTRIGNYKHTSDLGRFKWKDLYDHKAIIHIPYNVSIMSICEQYTANVPLFFPTINFGKKLNGYMSELFFVKYYTSYKELRDKTTLNLSDFYDDEWMPYVEYFDSINSLEQKMNYLDLNDISNNMKVFNISRQTKVLNLWKGMIECTI